MDVSPASTTTLFFPLFYKFRVSGHYSPLTRSFLQLSCVSAESLIAGEDGKLKCIWTEERGHLTWPQTRRDLAAAALQFTIRINPVILQNRPSYTKAVYKKQLTLPSVCNYTSSETDIVLTT